MKMKHIYRATLMVGIMLAFSHCTEEVEPKPLTYTQLLTGKESKAWRLTTIRIIDDGADSGPINARQLLNNCTADDVYMFYANDVKTFEVQEGTSKCNAADPDVYVEDTWSLVNATATLTFVMPILTTEFALPFTIKSLTEDTLVVELYLLEGNLSYRFTFRSQNG